MAPPMCAGMRWIRSNIAFGSRLALFALALQLALSFGHVHPEDLSAAAAPGVAAAIAGSAAADQSPQPTNHKPALPAADYCSICASIQLTGASVPSAAPVLPLPADFGRLTRAVPAAPTSAVPPRLLFQARAPPFA